MNSATQTPTDLNDAKVQTGLPALSPELTREIDRVLMETRSMLKRRVWQEALGRAVVVMVGWFIAVWCLDYFPIWLGGSEMPQSWRLTLLLLGISILGYTLWRWGWNRAAVPSSDVAIALLLENRYPQLEDRLATVVSLRSEIRNGQEQKIVAEGSSAGAVFPEPIFREPIFFAATTNRLLETLQQLPIAKLFDWTAVRRWTQWSLACVVLLVLAAILIGPWLSIAFAREVLLDQRRWPRQSDIQLSALHPVVSPRLGQLLGETPTLQPTDGKYLVGQGSDVEMIVEAVVGSFSSDSQTSQTGAAQQFYLPGHKFVSPRRCVMLFEDQNGNSGRQYLTKFGSTADDREGFRYDGPPLQRIESTVRLDVYGDDDYFGPIELVPVQNLALVRLDLECQFPDYLQASGGSRWLPGTTRWVEGATLPSGTDVVLHLEFNKPVQRILLLPNGSANVQLDWQDKPTSNVRLPIGVLETAQDWELWAEGSDQVWSRQPMRFAIGVQLDRPPEVQVDLKGIGNAVTADVRLPIVSQASDDYGLQEVTAVLQLPVQKLAETNAEATDVETVETVEENVDRNSKSESQASMSSWSTALIQQARIGAADADEQSWQAEIDLRQWQQQYQKVASLVVDQQQSIQLQVIAKDFYQGEDSERHRSVSQTLHLEVVSPANLLRLLKRSEVGQRRRLEQIYDELMDQRFYLQRAASLLEQTAEGAAAGESVSVEKGNDESSPTESGVDSQVNPIDMVSVYTARSVNQNEKSRQELLGVLVAFEDIVLQIVNNRLEAAEYRRRLEGTIVGPMQELTSQKLPATGQLLNQLTGQIADLSPEDSVMTSAAAEDELQSKLDLAAMERTRQTVQQAMVANDECLKLLDQVLRDLLKFESDAELYDMVRKLYDLQKQLMDETGRQQQEQAFDDLFGN